MFELRVFFGNDALTGTGAVQVPDFRGSLRDAEPTMARLVVATEDDRIIGERKASPEKVTLSKLIAEPLSRAELAPER